MLAAILGRVSGDDQEIKSQLVQLRDQVSRDGNTLAPGAEYIDDGVSGQTGNLHNRKGLLRFIADVQRVPRPFDVVYCWDVDRWLRSEDAEEQAKIIGPLQRSGVALRTRNGEQPPLTTALGRIWFHWQLEAAAEWLQKHRDRVKMGKEEAIKAGRKPAGPTPFGLTYDRERGTWGICERAAAIVREIIRRVGLGEGCWTIALDLQHRGVPRDFNAGRKKKKRMAPCWTRERVHALATSRTYIGEWTCDKKRRLVLQVPALVTVDEFEAAQATFRGYGLRGKPRAKHVYLIEGIGRCEVCKSAIFVAAGCTPKGRKPRPAYYVCRRRLRPAIGEARCTLPMRQVSEVDARVWARIVGLLADPEVFAEALTLRSEAAAGDGRDWQSDLDGFERQLRQVEGRRRVLSAQFADGLLEQGDLDGALKKINAQVSMLRRNIDNARAQAASAAAEREHAESVLANLATLRARAESQIPEERRDVVRRLIPGSGDAVVVLGTDGRIRLGIAPVESPSAGDVCAPSGAATSCARPTNHLGAGGVLLLTA
jgi:DNA invertase Pin-like site-specific DNA recombinase